MSISNQVNENDQILREGIDVNALSRDHIVWTLLIHPEVRESYYEISNHGEIRRARDQLVMTTTVDRIDRYSYLNLIRPINLENNRRKAHLSVHRLVALAFLQNPNNLRTVDHINRDRQDNHVSNLRWASHSDQNANQNERNRENIVDRISVEQLHPQTREVVQQHESMTAAALAVNGTKSSISAACRSGKLIYGYYWQKTSQVQITELEAAPAPPRNRGAVFNEVFNELTLEETTPDITEVPEEWRPIVTKTGETINTHMISNRGFIRSNDRPDIVRQGARDRDAFRCEIRQNGKKRTFGVHDLVASTYIRVPEDPKKEDVWHKNRDRSDNRVENLEWITKKEFKLRLTYNNAKSIRVTYSDSRTEVYNSIGRAAEATNINASTISHIVNGLKPQRKDIQFHWITDN